MWGSRRRAATAGTTTRLPTGAQARPGEQRPQCSACFINSVQDSLESILRLAKTEGMLFKWGSGTGTNLSTLREEDAILSGAGAPRDPLAS